MTIRKANKKDIKECLELQKLDKQKIWKSENFKDAIKDKKVIFLVAEDKKKIVGYVFGYVDPCINEDVIIHEIRVNRRERRKGIGTKLMSAFCKECFKKGIKDIAALIKPEHLKFYVGSCKFKKGEDWIAVSKKK